MTWVDGRLGVAIDCRDRGLQYGDGAFETMRIRRGDIRLLGHHFDRLQEACDRLALHAPAWPRLREEVRRCAAHRPEGVLKLILTRGTGRRGYRPTGRERTTRIVTLDTLPPQVRASGAPTLARVCAMRLGTNRVLAGLKTLNRLESVLARAEWRDPRIWEGLMRDADDHIVCGTMTNFFLRRGSHLFTPPVDRCGVAGVMRRWVLEVAPSAGLVAREVRLRWEDLHGADEAFLTNAVAGVVPLAGIRHGAARLKFTAHAAARALNHRLEDL